MGESEPSLWDTDHLPVLDHNVGPKGVHQLLPVAFGFEVHHLGFEAHPGGIGQACVASMLNRALPCQANDSRDPDDFQDRVCLEFLGSI